jgi:hypothetical protein
MSKYDLSLDKGQTWNPVTKTEARRRVSKTYEYVAVQFRHVDQGKILDMLGWGWLRRHPGRWNIKPELNPKKAKQAAYYFIHRYSGKENLPEFLLAMRDKDRRLIIDGMVQICKKQLDKIKDEELRFYKEYFDKMEDYSPNV